MSWERKKERNSGKETEINSLGKFEEEIVKAKKCSELEKELKEKEVSSMGNCFFSGRGKES